MSTFHRNFEFRVSPRAEQRSGRFHTPTSGDKLLIGAPVKVDTSADPSDLNMQKVILATGATAPKKGQMGILIHEFKNDEAFADRDPLYTTYSDLAHAPHGAAVQVVHGEKIKVAFRNTNDLTFLNTRTYTGRTMVAELGATPAVVVGDYLTPGTGNDTDGYWAKTTDASEAWLVVTAVDYDRGEVEAEFVF